MINRNTIRVFLFVVSVAIITIIVNFFIKPNPLDVSVNSCSSRISSLDMSREFSAGCVSFAERLARGRATRKDAYMIHVGGLYSIFDLDDRDKATELFTKAMELGYAESEKELLTLFENYSGKYCEDMNEIINKMNNRTDMEKAHRKIWTDSWAQQGCESQPQKA